MGGQCLLIDRVAGRKRCTRGGTLIRYLDMETLAAFQWRLSRRSPDPGKLCRAKDEESLIFICV